MKQCDAILYLGGLISNDGQAESELSRRIGNAHGEYRKLRQVWNHANLTKTQKLKFFEAFVLSKLTYGLATTWLKKAQRRHLDGFHARCLRRMLGIPAAFISRISNAAVFEQAKVRPVVEQVLNRQLLLLRRVGCSPAGSLLRKNTLVGDTAIPVVGSYVRRVGRPRLDWTSQVIAEAVRRCGSGAIMEKALVDKGLGGERRWRALMT